MRSPQTGILVSIYALESNIKPLTLLEVLDVRRRERDADFVDLGGRKGRASRVVFLILRDVAHRGAVTIESAVAAWGEQACEQGRDGVANGIELTEGRLLESEGRLAPAWFCESPRRKVCVRRK